jgi:hypothetical protein
VLDCVDNLACAALTKAQYLGLRAKEKLTDFVTDEEGDVNVVSIVILIGIAIVLALLFKEKITQIVNNLLTNIGTKASEATK